MGGGCLLWKVLQLQEGRQSQPTPAGGMRARKLSQRALSQSLVHAVNKSPGLRMSQKAHLGPGQKGPRRNETAVGGLERLRRE